LHFHYAKALRENAQPYRFWGLLDSCLAASECSAAGNTVDFTEPEPSFYFALPAIY
jgi:hypothetical protein